MSALYMSSMREDAKKAKWHDLILKFYAIMKTGQYIDFL